MKTGIVLLGMLMSLNTVAGTTPSPHEQVEMNKHLKTAKHAGAQPAVDARKEVDKKTAQTK